jgi:hypothetical protein
LTAHALEILGAMVHSYVKFFLKLKKKNMSHFCVVHAFRLRHKKTAVRKYGVLASREDVELTPLGAEDEDEDMALFDMTAVKSRP